ncbi:MAG TPA: HAD-IB family hydrolase [Puia sp.]|nr:HAD-IB family hydrolase [Puia sp.]
MTQKIAFFDFDGTITTKDTLLEFIRHSKGTPRFYLGFILNSPWLIAYKLKLISNQTAKERVLSFFFKRTPLDRFERHCESFSRDILPTLIRPKALEEITKLRTAGASVVIVSASPENWIRTWATTLEVELLATRLETKPGKDPAKAPRLTGKILQKNCHGEEKVRRIKEAYTLDDYQEIYTYGDTGGDRPMLKLGTASFYKPFR